MSTLPGKLGPITTGRLAGGLLAASRPLDATFNNWRQGINFNPNCSSQYGLYFCTDPDDAVDKDAINPVAEPIVFDPFIAFQGRSCSTWMTTEDLLDLARRGLESTISSAFARQLQTGIAGVQPSLNSEATDITPGGGAVNLVNTLSGLVSASVECGISDLVFHGNVRILPFLLNLRLVNWDHAEKLWKMGPWPFVLDNYGPTGPGNVDEETDGSTAWVYVTGPIEVATGPEMNIEGLDVRFNEKTELVERLGILRFEPCCVQAALACLGSGACV